MRRDNSLNRISNNLVRIGNSNSNKNSKNNSNSFKKNKKISFYLLYIMLFSLGIIVGYQDFFYEGKSFIWNPDGYSQHFPIMIYIGEYYREIIKNFVHGNFLIPQYDFHLATGESIISTLNYYGLGDAILFLSPFVTLKNAENAYFIFILLRMFLSGVSFSYYCFSKKRGYIETMIGTISYVFSGYVIFSSIRHPYFMNAMILMPLIFLGIDKVLEGKKPYLFITSIFLGASSGFYFFYMESIMMFIYAVIRYFGISKDSKRGFSLVDLIVKFMKSLGYYFVGIMISGIFLIPTLMLYFSSSRTSGEGQKLSLYDLLFYNTLKYGHAYVDFISGPATWTCIGMCTLTMIAVIVLFCRKGKGLWQLKVGAVIGFLLLLIPVGGYALNGFSYIANRWTFAFTFLLSYIIVITFKYYTNMRKREIILVGGATIVYTIVVYGFAMKYSPLCFYAPIILWVTYLVCLFLTYMRWKSSSFCNSKISKFSGIIMLCLIVLNCYFNVKITCDKKFDNYVSEFVDYGTWENKISKTSNKVKEIEDSGFYRVDVENRGNINESILGKYNGISGYFSLINKNIPDFLKEMKCSPDIMLSHKFLGVDDRTILETLFGVKYIISDQGKNMPYGFVKTNDEKIYLNSNALPMGYTYSYILNEKEYEKMTVLEKQSILLQGAVISNISENTVEDFKKQMEQEKESVFENSEQGIYNVKYSMALENIEWDENGKFVVKKNSGNVKLNFQGKGNSETYLMVKGLDSNPSGIEKFQVRVIGANGEKKFMVTSKVYNWYTGNTEYMVNLGYSVEGMKDVKIVFPKKGEFKLEGLEIYTYSFDEYENQINELKEDSLENVKQSTNRIEGTINLDVSKVLTMEMEYDKGWSLYVDGIKSDTCMVNGVFEGAFLSKGKHTIVWKYETPGLKIGFFTSIFGFILFIVIISYNKLKKNRSSVLTIRNRRK